MSINLTPAAADRVHKFLAARGHGLGLKLGVRKTGCSGFAYVIEYADQAAPLDLVFEDRAVNAAAARASPPRISFRKPALPI